MKIITLPKLALLLFICMLNVSAVNPSFNLQKGNFTHKPEALKSNFNTSVNSPFANTGFWENKGQIVGTKEIESKNIKFVLKSENTTIFLLNTGLAYQFINVKEPIGCRIAGEDTKKIEELRKKTKIETYRMDITLLGANPKAKISTQGKSDYYMNFASQKIYNIHNYEKVTYQEIYPGIDWVLYFKEGKVKYDFVLKPGADPSLIRMTFANHESIKLNRDGSFTLKNKLGCVTEKKPVSFQGKEEIETRFKLNKNELFFELNKYDSSKELTIDPAVVWATYYGGDGLEYGPSCTTDASGNIYLVGNSQSTLNIASGGYQNTNAGGTDPFVVKFNSSGVRQWATYYGGTSFEYASSCVTDVIGNVYIAGYTQSTINIASGGHQNSYGGNNDAFLVKFNSSGVRQWATYYGGAQYDDARSCATDASGNIYIAGTTESTVNIASGGYQNSIGGSNHDAFLVKFNSSGVRQWATYYGGNGVDFCSSCVTDVSGNVYIAGTTGSTNNIASGGHQNSYGGNNNNDAYLVKFDASGIRLWGTYYGGSGNEIGSSCVPDASGNIYLAGITQSTANIASGGYQNSLGGNNDSYLVKFNSSGVRQWATYYGGTGYETGSSTATDVSGNVYLTGETTSTVNIASSGYQNSLSGSSDAYLVKFDNLGTRSWATYYGDVGDETGYSCATDVSGNIYLAGVTQSTVNISSGGFQNTFGGYQDTYLVKFCNNPVKPSVIAGNTINCGSVIQTFSVSNDLDASSYSWVLPTGWSGSSNTNVIACTLTATGILTVNAINSCSASLAQTLNVIVEAIPVLTVNSGSICSGKSYTISPSGANTYTITGGNFVVSPGINSSYTITGTSVNGCAASNTAVASVSVYDTPSITVNSATICSGNSVVITPTAAGISLFNITGGSFTVSPSINSTYSVTGTGTNGCVSSNIGLALVSVNITPTISVNSGTVCSGLSYVISPIGANTYTITGGSFTVAPITTSSYSIVGLSSDGCISANIVVSTVTVFNTPTLTVNSGSICSGNNYVIMPSGASVYTITGGSFTVNPNTTTSYSVTGSSTVGCVSSNAVSNVTVYSTPTLVVNSGSICSGNSFAIIPSGANTYTITGANYTVSPNTTTSFSVTGTNAAGCVSTNALSTVTVNPLPTLTVNSGSICSGNTFIITPTGASTYSVSGGSFSVSPNISSSYTVIGTSAAGCLSSNTVVSYVTVNASPTLVVNSGSICSGNSFVITPTGADTYSITGGTFTVSPASTCIYSVTGTSTAGCISQTTAISTVTVHTTPTLNVLGGPTTMCSGESTTFSVSGASDYTWSTGENINTIVVSPTITTTYTVTGSDVNGCKSLATLTQSVDACTGLNQLSISASVKLYPNPNNGEFVFKLSELEGATITITDVLGQRVFEKQIMKGETLVSTGLSKGLYFYFCHQNTLKGTSGRLIVQ